MIPFRSLQSHRRASSLLSLDRVSSLSSPPPPLSLLSRRLIVSWLRAQPGGSLTCTSTHPELPLPFSAFSLRGIGTDASPHLLPHSEFLPSYHGSIRLLPGSPRPFHSPNLSFTSPPITVRTHPPGPTHSAPFVFITRHPSSLAFSLFLPFLFLSLCPFHQLHQDLPANGSLVSCVTRTADVYRPHQVSLIAADRRCSSLRTLLYHVWHILCTSALPGRHTWRRRLGGREERQTHHILSHVHPIVTTLFNAGRAETAVLEDHHHSVLMRRVG